MSSIPKKKTILILDFQLACRKLFFILRHLINFASLQGCDRYSFRKTIITYFPIRKRMKYSKFAK